MEDIRDKFHRDGKTEMEMAKEIFGWRYDGESAIDNYRFDNLFDKYISLHCPDIEKWIDTVFEKQKVNRRYYCDMDWYITIVMNTPEKRVLFVENVVTCADITKYLVIQDIRKDYKMTTHLRLVWDDDVTDYQKKNYTEKPNFKWYEDRGFDLKFKQEWHMGPLGGSYADCRDSGFLMTFSKDFNFNCDIEVDINTFPEELRKVVESVRGFKDEYGEYTIEKGSLYRYSELKAKLWDLYGAWKQLNEEEKESKEK
jgi:hypothetical protein